MVEIENNIIEGTKTSKPLGAVHILEDFFKLKKPDDVKNLIKQVVIDGINCPIINIDLKDLSQFSTDERFLNKFLKTPEKLLEDAETALINEAQFNLDFKERYSELIKLEHFEGIHLIPNFKEVDWLIPLRENLSIDLTGDREKIFRFLGRFMSLGLERKVEFKKMVWVCLVCGTEFETSVLRKTRERYRTPSFCSNSRCKVKSKQDFMLLPEKSTTFEKRTFTIIDRENQDIINEFECYIDKNIQYFEKKAKNLNTNEEIEVLGILKTDTADLFSNKEEQDPFYYIKVLDIRSGTANDLDPQVIKQIQQILIKDSSYNVKIIDSIHPYSQGIINFFPIKLLYSLSFITSDSWDDEKSKRNGLNSLVGGHAGTLKSAIGRYFKKILGANNFGIIYGKNTTAKGLVPVAQRNNNEKNLVKRYGAIPFYNRKTFLIDEAQYLYKKDTDALECFKCYEEGIISRALDGTTISAEAKGTCIFGLNYYTQNEAYDYSEPLIKNLGFPEDQKSILDRFDLHYRIPKNTKRIVKILNKRDSESYKPKFQETDEVIYNYLMEAKRLYSNGVQIPEDIFSVLEKFYDEIILEQKGASIILNPREPHIIKKVLKGIAALHFRDIVLNEDLEFFKEYLINTMIPFQDNKHIRKIQTIDMDAIFQNAFNLLIELYGNCFLITDFISFLIEYVENNYFPSTFGDRKDDNIPTIDKFLSQKLNLSNTQFKILLENNLKFISNQGYIVDKIKNTTAFISIDWGYNLVSNEISELFTANNTKELELKNIGQILELNLDFSEDFLNKVIDSLINEGVFIKRESKLILI